jgi:hypothetical protein
MGIETDRRQAPCSENNSEHCLCHMLKNFYLIALSEEELKAG